MAERTLSGFAEAPGPAWPQDEPCFSRYRPPALDNVPSLLGQIGYQCGQGV